MEITKNKWLCGGTAKKVGDDKYEVRYFVQNDPKNGTKRKIMNGDEVKEFMIANHLFTYLN